jgi:hypothetical protein
MCGYFAKAVVCESGHLVTSNAESEKGPVTPYCMTCGKKIIDKCQHCGQDIPGEEFAETNGLEITYDGMGTTSGPLHESLGFRGVPKYCPSCGKPYPWTQSAIEAALDYIDTLIVLDTSERHDMKKALDNIVADSPKSAPAARRLVQLSRKAGKEALKFFQQVLAGVVCEAAKREMWG